MTPSGFNECDKKNCHRTAEHEVWFDGNTLELLCEECAKKTYFEDDDALGIADLDPGTDFEVIT